MVVNENWFINQVEISFFLTSVVHFLKKIVSFNFQKNLTLHFETKTLTWEKNDRDLYTTFY